MSTVSAPPSSSPLVARGERFGARSDYSVPVERSQYTGLVYAGCALALTGWTIAVGMWSFSSWWATATSVILAAVILALVGAAIRSFRGTRPPTRS